MPFLRGSVGYGGDNFPDDVRATKALLRTAAPRDDIGSIVEAFWTTPAQGDAGKDFEESVDYFVHEARATSLRGDNGHPTGSHLITPGSSDEAALEERARKIAKQNTDDNSIRERDAPYDSERNHYVPMYLERVSVGDFGITLGSERFTNPRHLIEIAGDDPLAVAIEAAFRIQKQHSLSKREVGLAVVKRDFLNVDIDINDPYTVSELIKGEETKVSIQDTRGRRPFYTVHTHPATRKQFGKATQSKAEPSVLDARDSYLSGIPGLIVDNRSGCISIYKGLHANGEVAKYAIIHGNC